MVAINYSTGEQVNYQGRDAVIVSNNYESHTLTVRLNNGELVTVDRNDLFGMNQKKSSVNEDIQKRIDRLDEDIKKGEKRIKEYKSRYNTALDMRHNSRRDINSLFFTLGIDSESEITNKSDRKKYDKLHNSYTWATSEWIRSSSEIISTVNSTVSDILTRHKWQLQQYLT